MSAKEFAPSAVRIISWAEIRHIVAIESLAYDRGISKREALECVIDNDPEAKEILDRLTCTYSLLIGDGKMTE